MHQAKVVDKGLNKNAAPKNQLGIVFLLIFIFLAAGIVSGGFLMSHEIRTPMNGVIGTTFRFTLQNKSSADHGGFDLSVPFGGEGKR